MFEGRSWHHCATSPKARRASEPQPTSTRPGNVHLQCKQTQATPPRFRAQLPPTSIDQAWKSPRANDPTVDRPRGETLSPDWPAETQCARETVQNMKQTNFIARPPSASFVEWGALSLIRKRRKEGEIRHLAKKSNTNKCSKHALKLQASTSFEVNNSDGDNQCEIIRIWFFATTTNVRVLLCSAKRADATRRPRRQLRTTPSMLPVL